MEIYAATAEIADDRVKAVSYTESSFSVSGIVESTNVIPPAEFKRGDIAEFTADEYTQRVSEADALKNTTTDDDTRAASDILSKTADRRLQELSSINLFKTSSDHFQTAFAIRLFTVKTLLAREEVDRRITKTKQIETAVVTKYNSTPSYTDRLRRAAAASDDSLASPVRREGLTYGDMTPLP
jgi:hypothetical protein